MGVPASLWVEQWQRCFCGVRHAVVVLTQGSFDNTGHHFPIQHSSLSHHVRQCLAFTVILVLSTTCESKKLYRKSTVVFHNNGS